MQLILNIKKIPFTQTINLFQKYWCSLVLFLTQFKMRKIQHGKTWYDHKKNRDEKWTGSREYGVSVSCTYVAESRLYGVCRAALIERKWKSYLSCACTPSPCTAELDPYFSGEKKLKECLHVSFATLTLTNVMPFYYSNSKWVKNNVKSEEY